MSFFSSPNPIVWQPAVHFEPAVKAAFSTGQIGFSDYVRADVPMVIGTLSADTLLRFPKPQERTTQPWFNRYSRSYICPDFKNAKADRLHRLGHILAADLHDVGRDGVDLNGYARITDDETEIIGTTNFHLLHMIQSQFGAQQVRVELALDNRLVKHDSARSPTCHVDADPYSSRSVHALLQDFDADKKPIPFGLNIIMRTSVPPRAIKHRHLFVNGKPNPAVTSEITQRALSVDRQAAWASSQGKSWDDGLIVEAAAGEFMAMSTTTPHWSVKPAQATPSLFYRLVVVPTDIWSRGALVFN